MDSFLKEIDTELLKRWLLNQNEDDWDVKEVNDTIVIETKYGLGSIVLTSFFIIHFFHPEIKNS